jgi:hypothetical protein
MPRTSLKPEGSYVVHMFAFGPNSFGFFYHPVNQQNLMNILMENPPDVSFPN